MSAAARFCLIPKFLSASKSLVNYVGSSKVLSEDLSLDLYIGGKTKFQEQVVLQAVMGTKYFNVF